MKLALPLIGNQSEKKEKLNNPDYLDAGYTYSNKRLKQTAQGLPSTI